MSKRALDQVPGIRAGETQTRITKTVKIFIDGRVWDAIDNVHDYKDSPLSFEVSEGTPEFFAGLKRYDPELSDEIDVLAQAFDAARADEIDVLIVDVIAY